jgi:hypothetical protein
LRSTASAGSALWSFEEPPLKTTTPHHFADRVRATRREKLFKKSDSCWKLAASVASSMKSAARREASRTRGISGTTRANLRADLGLRFRNAREVEMPSQDEHFHALPR